MLFILLKALLAAACYARLSHGAITIIPGGEPKPFAPLAGVSSPTDFFRRSAPNEFVNNSAQLIMSSLDMVSPTSLASIQPSGDSFVRGAIQAWGEHLHLVIRPEEVWFTILVQMNFYMNSHAESIRHLFVDHEGQQEIYIEDFTWWDVLIRFQDEIQARVKTPWLQEWLMPAFTTTNDNDRMTANILMMGLMKAYFTFSGGIICGLPSVTLLGEKSDWEALLAKLDRLPEFGPEPTAYAARLAPILSRFVSSFDQPDSVATKTFWNQIVSARRDSTCGAPPYYVSGWIMGFLYWNTDGSSFARGLGDFTLDGITYPNLDISRQLPVGYARVPFVMHDFNYTELYEAYLMSGTLGKQIKSGAPAGYLPALARTRAPAPADTTRHGTLKPLSAWMLYGPVVHNATAPAWVREIELANITQSISNNYDAAQCRVDI
jgi:hypothetical protein